MPAQRMLAFLERRGIEGATVLEIGGGIGEMQIALLKHGAAGTTNLELSPGYDEEAMRLVRAAAVEGRAERRLHDIAADPGGVEPADIVVLHRVVFCYPDYARLLGGAADHAPQTSYREGRSVGVRREWFRVHGACLTQTIWRRRSRSRIGRSMPS